jgi:hypothetical protein
MFRVFQVFQLYVASALFFLTETAGESPTVFSFTFQLNEKIQKTGKYKASRPKEKKGKYII